MNFVVTDNFGSRCRFRPRVRSKTGSSRQDIRRLAVTNNIVTHNGEFGSGLNSDVLVVSREDRAVIIVIDRFHHNIVHATLGERGRVGVSRRSGSKLSIHIPLIAGSRESEGRDIRFKMQLIVDRESNRSLRTNERVGRISHRKIADELEFGNTGEVLRSFRSAGIRTRDDSLHRPVILQISGGEAEGVLGSRGKGLCGSTLEPLVAHREHTVSGAQSCHQIIGGSGSAGVGRTVQRDSEVHLRERVHRGFDHGAILHTHFDSKLVNQTVIQLRDTLRFE